MSAEPTLQHRLRYVADEGAESPHGWSLLTPALRSILREAADALDKARPVEVKGQWEFKEGGGRNSYGGALWHEGKYLIELIPFGGGHCIDTGNKIAHVLNKEAKLDEQIGEVQTLIMRVNATKAALDVLPPIPMRLPCPQCHRLHVDSGEFATKPHHTHACQYCGEVWRPAIVDTVGVEFLPGFKNEPKPDPKRPVTIEEVRQGKWLAFYDDATFEQPVGWGPTPHEATLNLIRHS